MSAIFGLICLDGRPVPESELALMSTAMAAHGPDGGGIWTHGHVGLGQRLMRFTPEDLLERQPLVSLKAQHVLVADARIDNRPELAGELGISRNEVPQMPDSAFILRAYEKWGVDCPGHLIGAFAFALYDLREEHILIARSHTGERTLFYYETPKVFAFSSAPKGLFALPYVPREIDQQRIADYLVSVPGEPGSSFFSRVTRLQAGHSIVVGRDGFRSRQYWTLDLKRETRFSRDEDYVEALDALFDRVIADQLRSLTPVGVMMSGGLDSTSVAAASASILKREGKRLVTFTEVPRAGFNGAITKGRYPDETPCVEAMARRYDNLDLNFIRTDGKFYLDGLDRFFAAADAPFRNASNRCWIEAIIEESRRRNVRILLTGGTGNLTISWDGMWLLPQLLREWKWSRAFHEARALAAQRAGHSTARILAGALMPLLPARLWSGLKRLHSGNDSASALPPWMAHSPIRGEFAKMHQVQQRAGQKGYDFKSRPKREARSEAILRLADSRGDTHRGYEALFGVQTRDPTADLRIVEYCLSLPEEQYLREGTSRWLVRRLMADRLPSEVLANKQRGLQAADWFERLTLAGPRITGELARFERSELTRSAIDLGRMRELVNHLPDWTGSAERALRDYRGVLEGGIMTGQFLAWVESGA